MVNMYEQHKNAGKEKLLEWQNTMQKTVKDCLGDAQAEVRMRFLFIVYNIRPKRNRVAVAVVFLRLLKYIMQAFWKTAPGKLLENKDAKKQMPGAHSESNVLVYQGTLSVRSGWGARPITG